MALGPRTAIISGISGQDGQYLTQWLLGRGYRVVGLVRSNTSRWRASLPMRGAPELHAGSVTDTASLVRVLRDVRPDEVYHLSAISYVPDSWSQPIESARINGLSVICWLEAIRYVDSTIRFFNASSAAIYGDRCPRAITETSCPSPGSPYATAKLLGQYATVNFRESFGLYCCNGVLFNHESPLRPESFVTRRITRGVAEIKQGIRSHLELSNLDSQRDWGFAGDFVRGFWTMLQQDRPSDYVLATGKAHSVEEFVARAFSLVDLAWKRHVNLRHDHHRPSGSILIGDPSKATKELGWKPEVSWEQLVELMVQSDLDQVRREKSSSGRSLP